MIYADYAATAPLRPSVRKLMLELSERPLGNASSLHRPGHRARMILEDARERCAHVLGALVEEIVFTSGATEANNLALRGWMRLQPPGSHLLVSAVEHPSVWDCAHALEGYEVEVVPVDLQGRVDSADVERRLRPDTCLVSVMAVNNEVGTVQPIAALAELCQRRGVKLHVDAVQAAVAEVIPGGVDFLSLSAHKLGGPVGSGLLYIRQGIRLDPILLGGSQEDSRRAGTSNVMGAACLALALEEARATDPVPLLALRNRLEAGLAAVPASTLLSAEAARSPHISAWLFEGVSAEPLLVRLDLAGIAASSGSACSSHSLEPSRIVSAMGFSSEQARSLIRFSLGFASTPSDVDAILEQLPRAVEQVRGKQAARS